MIAVDTNILVYAHRTETPQHQAALEWLTRLAEGTMAWGLPVFCIGEFIRITTHPRIFNPPSTLGQACGALAGLFASPTLRVLFPGLSYSTLLMDAVQQADARGNLAFDAQIAAVCQEAGCLRLLTLDRDFARFPQLKLISVIDRPDRHLG